MFPVLLVETFQFLTVCAKCSWFLLICVFGLIFYLFIFSYYGLCIIFVRTVHHVL